ncbi:MAG TPA: ATP-binding protein [Steroidobacteraceae bacterium]|nr:ATP-binding protein [Steroidobacteraceae bacterium]
MSWPRYLTLSSLERRVFLVALAGLVPLAMLAFALLISGADAQRTRLLRAHDDTMMALLSAIDSELTSAFASLDVLASSPRLVRGDFAALKEEALELMRRRPSWANVVVSDARGQVMNARYATAVAPESTPPEPEVGEVIRTRQPLVGNLQLAPVFKEYAAPVRIPFIRDGEVRYVLSAHIKPDAILNLLTPQNIEQPGVIAVFDRGYNTVARTLNSQTSLGQPASKTLLPLLQSGQNDGIATTLTREGVPVYTIFRRSPMSGWWTAVGISRNSVDGPVVRAYYLLGGALLFSVLLGLAAALLVGRTIVRPMRELEHQALLLGAGQMPRMPQTRLPEVRRVAVALGAAHDARETAFSREREARLAAEQASRAKDEFLAMLGHELRNPLAAITNASQIIDKKRAALDDSGAAAATIIGRQAKHLARLTDDLLDAGRVILGKISLSRAPVDLATAVRGSLEVLRGSGSFSRHQVDVELAPAWMHADVTRIDQIVSNLVTNAVKYTPPGGSIRIRTRLESQPSGNWAVLTVTDTGIGLEAELLPRVFDLFVQGERALDRSQGGLGIGLTLVRRLAELHGGVAEARSAGGGQGAEFSVRLPAIDAPAHAPPPAVSIPLLRGYHVALIEDNEDARMSLRMLLELEGHRVSEAGDGIAGVELLTSTPGIDIAFVDIGLPGMNGYATAQGIRAARGKSIRLVAMSGYGTDQDVERGERAGFDAYIVKPADMERVKQELAMLSAERRNPHGGTDPALR